MIKRILNSFRWANAAKHWRSEQYQTTISVLQKASFDNYYEAYALVMQAACYYHTGNKIQSDYYFEKALISLEKFDAIGKIHIQDAKYLSCFISFFKGKLDNLTLNNVDLDQVSNKLKSVFPLEMHEHWNPMDLETRILRDRD